ncbi:hypothetical protein [Nannocystis sp.]|uniref:nSTAND1 domain-containing NTPase n=1 Tax=Nannocystis sp. TaxID=1962667 RepID=UPI00344EDC7E
MKNPYVGPQPIGLNEKLFGRAAEEDELINRLSATRIVLLYSPSGAGKSSLILAGVIPQVRDQYDVWCPTRVGHPLPEGVTGNRYAVSMILGIEQDPRGTSEGRCRPGEAQLGRL